MLPIGVLLAKTLFLVEGLSLIAIGFKEIRALEVHHAGGSHVSPNLLLAYRVAMAALGFAIGVPQFMRRGFILFAFFTIWNWWLLTAYFVVAAVATLRHIRALQHATRAEPARAEELSAVWMDKVAATIFHVACPAAISIDGITWLLLVPVLMADPDPAKVAEWRELMFCFSSYMQHGGNAVMILGDMALNDVPLMPRWGKGWLTMWIALFGVWSTIFFIRTGRFIYPFLNFYSTKALAFYMGMPVFYWMVFLVFGGFMRAKQAALARWRAKKTQ